MRFHALIYKSNTGYRGEASDANESRLFFLFICGIKSLSGELAGLPPGRFAEAVGGDFHKVPPGWGVPFPAL